MAPCSKCVDAGFSVIHTGLRGHGFDVTMLRVVHVETLDGLAEADPAAMHSRRDLQRIHRIMGTRGIVRRALRLAARQQGRMGEPLRILELGAGDGSLMLGVARTMGRGKPAVAFTLLDRQNLVTVPTLEAFAEAGWSATARVCDVFDWVGQAQGLCDDPSPDHWDVIVCNLFLHHFEGAALLSLLAAIASCSSVFFACEPHRGRLALAASHAVVLIGANAVTRKDAVLSVRAGFRDVELSRMWPAPAGQWTLAEYRAGLFSHCFCAQKTRPPCGASPAKQ